MHKDAQRLSFLILGNKFPSKVIIKMYIQRKSASVIGYLKNFAFNLLRNQIGNSKLCCWRSKVKINEKLFSS